MSEKEKESAKKSENKGILLVISLLTIDAYRNSLAFCNTNLFKEYSIIEGDKAVKDD
jgi:hypothetical protein